MFITTLDPGGDAVGTDRRHHRRARDVVLVENDGPLEYLHATLNDEEKKILDAELHSRVRWINNPNTVPTNGFWGLHLHLCQPIGPISPIGPIPAFTRT